MQYPCQPCLQHLSPYSSIRSELAGTAHDIGYDGEIGDGSSYHGLTTALIEKHYEGPEWSSDQLYVLLKDLELQQKFETRT